MPEPRGRLQLDNRRLVKFAKNALPGKESRGSVRDGCPSFGAQGCAWFHDVQGRER